MSPCQQQFSGYIGEQSETHTALQIAPLHLFRAPPQKQTEKEMQKKGFDPDYTRGMNRLDEMLFVAEQLRKLNIDPNTTHIEYFAVKAFEHIEYAKQVILSEYGEDSMHMDLLKTQEILAKWKDKDKGITYKWWVRFNYRLAGILSGYYPGKIRKKEELQELMSLFPSSVLMPVTEGDFGIITITRLMSQDVYILGLLNKKETEVDGDIMNPIEFFIHDLEHVDLSSNHNRENSPIEINYMRRFHKKLIARIESLPFDQRKKMETAYFSLFHEFPIFPLYKKTDWAKEIKDNYIDIEKLSGKYVLDNYLRGEFANESTAIETFIRFIEELKSLADSVIDELNFQLNP